MSLMTPERRPKLIDGVIGLLLLMFGLNGTGPAGEGQHTAIEPDAVAFVLVVVAALPFLVWRRFPVPALALNGAAVSVYLALGYPFGPILFSAVAIDLVFAISQPVRRVLVAEGAVLAATAVALAMHAARAGLDRFEGTVMVFGATFWIVVPAAIGIAVRIRLEARARVRAEQARRAVSEEQLRMAQELHDVVGHGLAVIAMQAGVGLHVLDRNPTKTRESLEAIRDTSREALEGLRAELAALRAPHGAADTDTPRRPAPGLADLETLVRRVRSGGLEVTLRMDVGANELRPEVDRAAYRIVQESLTNVLRHAGAAATAKVRVRRRGDWLLLDVEDTGDGTGPGNLVEGSGVRGMRARTEELGGSFEASAGDQAGFAVRARLPVSGSEERVAR